jgi:hypothetical protein
MGDEVTTRLVEGRQIVTSGSLVCPAFALCDRLPGEKYSAYVRRHVVDHHLGEFESLEDAERNLGIWCFYYFHKYVFGNAHLIPQPFWEIHAFIAESEWNEDDLEERVPIGKKTFARIPDAALRRPGDVRRIKQIELPRQCEKTSAGCIAHPIFESLHEYYVNDERNYPIMIRCETAMKSRDSLVIIRAKSLNGKNIKRLYGVKLLRCGKCSERSHITIQSPDVCPGCGETKKVRVQAICLIDPTRGAGGTGKDSVTFRWATNTAPVGSVVQAPKLTLAAITGDDEDGGEVDEDDFEPETENEEAVYSIRATGLKTALTGQRPRHYKLDDIQSQDNSDTHEKRLKIQSRFDEAKRQVRFGGKMDVYDTRKYVDDFAGKIQEEPLRSLSHSLHRRVYWATDEPDNPPYVVGGMRYYYPIAGNGERQLDAEEVADLESQMIERDFSSEYLNDPTDPKRAIFKREHFIIEPHDDAPPEIKYGLGRDVSPLEQAELASLGLRIVAYNACDPAGIEEQKKKGDDNFIVCVRYDRYGRWHITKLVAGKWSSRRRWDEIAKASYYNNAQLTDYELPASEIDTKDSYDKWVRDRREELSAAEGAPAMVAVPIRFSHMPKSSKRQREDQMELFVPIYILDDACDKELRDKYISQWLGLGNKDHDDGPDATSRLIRYVTRNPYRKRAEEEERQKIQVVDGAAHVPLGMIRAAAKPATHGGTWGQQGGEPACRECNQRHAGACPAAKETTLVA